MFVQLLNKCLQSQSENDSIGHVDRKPCIIMSNFHTKVSLYTHPKVPFDTKKIYLETMQFVLTIMNLLCERFSKKIQNFLHFGAQNRCQ